MLGQTTTNNVDVSFKLETTHSYNHVKEKLNGYFEHQDAFDLTEKETSEGLNMFSITVFDVVRVKKKSPSSVEITYTDVEDKETGYRTTVDWELDIESIETDTQLFIEEDT